MTLEDAIEEMRQIPGGDPEEAHSSADSVLLRFLREKGYAELADEWGKVDDRCGGFWYA